MSSAESRRKALIRSFEGRDLPPGYRAFFACFNRGQFFEAHEVLEPVWLAERGRPDADFYRGLIQLAGAFVHLQKDRLRPAESLFRLAQANLQKYPAPQQALDTSRARALIGEWLSELEAGGFTVNPLRLKSATRLELEEMTGGAKPAGQARLVRRARREGRAAPRRSHGHARVDS